MLMMFKKIFKNKIINKKLINAITEIEKVDGYLVTVTELKGDELIHTYFMKNFRKDDIFSSLDEYAKLLEREIK